MRKTECPGQFSNIYMIKYLSEQPRPVPKTSLGTYIYSREIIRTLLTHHTRSISIYNARILRRAIKRSEKIALII